MLALVRLLVGDENVDCGGISNEVARMFERKSGRRDDTQQ